MIRSDFAAFIITFNRPDILSNTIVELCKQTIAPAKILVVNNGEKPTLDSLPFTEGVVLEEHMMGFNSGPAGASNFALMKLAAQNFLWIQWIDDDDPPRIPDLNERLFDHFGRLADGSIGIIGPVGSYFNRKTGIAVRVPNEDLTNNQYLYVQTIAGNQCMLISSAVVGAGCFPTPSLFFGFEETNFCLKVLEAGFKIVVPCDLFIEYRNLAGRWDLNKSDIRKMRTPAWRNYYSIRNLIYMFLYEFKKPGVVLRILARVYLRALFMLIRYGLPRGLSEIYFTFLATKHGLLKRLGLTVKPLAKHLPSIK